MRTFRLIQFLYAGKSVAYWGVLGGLGFNPPPSNFTHLQIEQNPWLGGYRPQIPVLSAFCLQLNLLNPLP
jgi:hypothetical protein